MSALDDHVADYLRLRRALGFKLERAGQILPQLVNQLTPNGQVTQGMEVVPGATGTPGDSGTVYYLVKKLAAVK